MTSLLLCSGLCLSHDYGNAAFGDTGRRSFWSYKLLNAHCETNKQLLILCYLLYICWYFYHL